MPATHLKEKILSITSNSNEKFNLHFDGILGRWCRVSQFIWDIQFDWFAANWRCSPQREALFLLLNNARVDLVSAIDSFGDGFLRGPNLLAKSSLEKVSAVVKLSNDEKNLDKFLKGNVIDKKWVIEVGKQYPEISTLYRFIESNFTHDPFASFAGAYAVRDCEIDKHITPPYVDHYLGIRWATIYSIQSSLLISAQFSDLFLNGGVNLWKEENGKIKTVHSPFHHDMDFVLQESEKNNKFLQEKYPGELKVFKF